MAASSRQQCPMSCVRLRLLSQILRCGKGLFFLAAASKQKEAEKQYEFLEHIRRALFKLRGADMADGGHVGHRCPAHLPCHRQKDGAQSAAAHGVRCHSGQPSRIRCHHAGRHRWPHLCPVRGRYVQRAVPVAAVHRHRCHDRFWPAAGKAVAHAVWRSGTVRHLFHPVSGRVLL